MKKILIAFLLILAAGPQLAFAGQISGKVTYKDGSPCSGCKVSASINQGGVTGGVYTDSSGRFTLSWGSANWIAELYVNGGTVARDVRPGQSVNVTVR